MELRPEIRLTYRLRLFLTLWPQTSLGRAWDLSDKTP